MASARVALTLSIVLLVAAVVLRSDAKGQTNAEAKGKNVGCGGSWGGGLYDSGSKFTVKVSTQVSTDIYGMYHHARPVGSTRVLLSRQDTNGDREVSRVTDSSGVAEFSDVPSGTYTVSVEGEHFFEATATVNVNALSSTATEVHVLWPQRAYSVRHVRGWLMDSNQHLWSSEEPNYKPRPLIAAPVQLIDMNSGAVLARTQTNGEGYYEFPSVDLGFYLVRFNEDSDEGSPNFNMAVEVDDKAAEEHPPALKAEKHDCASGLSLY